MPYGNAEYVPLIYRGMSLGLTVKRNYQSDNFWIIDDKSRRVVAGAEGKLSAQEVSSWLDEYEQKLQAAQKKEKT